MTPRSILSLTTAEKRKFIDSFDHVFSDIDGVVWNLTESIEGSAEGFEALQDMGKTLTFITNNCVRTDEQCQQKLREHKINIAANRIVNPIKAVIEYFRNIKFDGLIYVLACNAFKNSLRQAGFKVLDDSNFILKESVGEIMTHAKGGEPVKAVIVDFDFNMSYIKLMKAHFFLRQPDCLLIMGASDFLVPVTKDLSLLGPGPFAKILEQSSGKEMLTFGKPGKALGNLLMQRYHITSPDRILMIGDMLNSDINFATACGFQSLLVLSGGCSYDELMTQKDPSITPKYYAESMRDFTEFMRDLPKNNV